MQEVAQCTGRASLARIRWLPTFCVGAGCIALAAGWIALETARAQQHEQVVNELVKRGAAVLYNYQVSDGAFEFGAKPFYPRWWRDVTAPHFGTHVVEVTLLRANPDDELLQTLGPLKQLRTLAIDNCRQVTDAGLKSLEGLTRLTELSLSHTQLSGTGLVHLQNLRGLRVLRLNSTAIDDGSLRHLRGLSQLQILEIGSTGISRHGVAHLAKLTNLQRLGLQNTLVDDQALVFLSRLPSLQSLELSQTQVTPEGVAWLREQLPDCHIYCHFPTYSTAKR